MHHRHPVGLDDPCHAGGEHLDPFVGKRFGDRCAQREGGEARVGAVLVDDTDALDRHPIDGVDLCGQQRDQLLVGQRHHQLVDGPPRAVLEDLDRQHVAAHGTDAARDLTERTRAVGHPDSNDDGDHGPGR